MITAIVIAQIDPEAVNKKIETALEDDEEFQKKIDEQKINIDVLFIYFLLHLNKSIGYEIMTIDQSDIINDSKLYNDDIINIIKQLNQTIDVLYKLDADIISKIDLINKLKIIIYKHMKHNIIDLNDINAIKMLKYIKDERTS